MQRTLPDWLRLRREHDRPTRVRHLPRWAASAPLRHCVMYAILVCCTLYTLRALHAFRVGLLRYIRHTPYIPVTYITHVHVQAPTALGAPITITGTYCPRGSSASSIIESQ